MARAARGRMFGVAVLLVYLQPKWRAVVTCIFVPVVSMGGQLVTAAGGRTYHIYIHIIVMSKFCPEFARAEFAATTLY